MIPLLLMTGLALAQDAPEPDEAPETPAPVEEPAFVDPGDPDEPLKLELGDAYKAPQPSWVVPVWMFDQCLAAQQNLLEVCDPALARCTETSLARLEEAADSLDKTAGSMNTCLERFDEDETKIVELTTQVGVLETKNARLKGQRNTAWVVAGTAVAAIVVVGIVEANRLSQ